MSEALHEPFAIELEAVAPTPDVDLDAAMGQEASFSLCRGPNMPTRRWTGIVTAIERLEIEEDHLTTYRLVIRPRLWLLTQRRNYRIFQYKSDPESVLEVLGEWGITPRQAYDASRFKGRKYRVQYAETDYDFVRRLLEDTGLTFFFEATEAGSRLVIVDQPQAGSARPAPVRFEANPMGELQRELATRVRVSRRLRPGKYTQRDVDYRRPPEFPLAASASAGQPVETGLERFHHNYGAFLVTALPDGSTPAADDRGAARTDMGVGEEQVRRRLAAKRHDAKRCQFDTTAHDLSPGTVFSFADYPARDLADDVKLLVVTGKITGDNTAGDWRHEVEAFFADQPYHPPLTTPKPRTFGVESATVVGPVDDEIHTDELARIRVHFHWDRTGSWDDRASCWIPVSQPWGGAGFGAVNIPRVGQEVLVDFLGADPDRPVVVGRVFTKTQPVPYALPKYKTVSGIRSQSAYRMVMGGSGGGGPAAPGPVVGPLTTPNGMGSPMNLERLQEALDGSFQAFSPNAETHHWPGSEITFNDQFGEELFYMQAERDLSMCVKNQHTAIIGNGRSVKIGTDDLLDVDNDQMINVGGNRCVAVAGSQAHQITGDVSQVSVEGDQTFHTAKSLSSFATHHLMVSAGEGDESFTLQVGESVVYMRKDFIIVQTPYLFLNPGPAALEAAITTGDRPMTPEEAAAAAHEADVQALMGEIDQAWQNGDIRNPYDLERFNDSYIYDGRPMQAARERWDAIHRPPGAEPHRWNWAPQYQYEPFSP